MASHPESSDLDLDGEREAPQPSLLFDEAALGPLDDALERQTIFAALDSF